MISTPSSVRPSPEHWPVSVRPSLSLQALQAFLFPGPGRDAADSTFSSFNPFSSIPPSPQRPVYSPGLWPCHLRDSPDHQGPGDWLGSVIDSLRRRNNRERYCTVWGEWRCGWDFFFKCCRPGCRLKTQLTAACPLHWKYTGLLFVAGSHNGSAPHQKNHDFDDRHLTIMKTSFHFG